MFGGCCIFHVFSTYIFFFKPKMGLSGHNTVIGGGESVEDFWGCNWTGGIYKKFSILWSFLSFVPFKPVIARSILLSFSSCRFSFVS